METFLFTILLFCPLFSNAQSFKWAKRMGGNSNDIGNAIATDSLGNVYTLGAFQGTVDFDPGPDTSYLYGPSQDNIFIQKLDSSGSFIWAKKIIGGPHYGSDNIRASSIALDSHDNIYLTGWFTDTVDFDPGPGVFNLVAGTSSDVFIEKLDSAGNFVWAKNMHSASSSSVPNSISVDREGNSYTTGYFFGTIDANPDSGVYDLTTPTTSGYPNTFIEKLDSAGNFIWAKQIGNVGLSDIEGNSILEWNSKEVYLTGFFTDTADLDPGSGSYRLSSNGSNDIFIEKLDSAGNFIWARHIGGNHDDGGKTLAVDDIGNIYICGHFQGPVDFDPGSSSYYLSGDSTGSGYFNMFIEKLDSSGNFAWANENIGCPGSCTGNSIAIDSGNNIYTTGYFSGTIDFNPGADSFKLMAIRDLSSSGQDAFIQKLDSGGNFIAAYQIRGTGFDTYGAGPTTQGNAIITGTRNCTYITGYFDGSDDFDPGPDSTILISNGWPFSYYRPPDVFIQKMNFTPSSIIVSNVIPNNSDFPNQKVLWSGTNNDVASTIKICADASKATQIVFVNKTGVSNGKIRFWVTSDPYGANSAVSGYFINTDYSYSGDTIRALFTHPKYLEAAYKPYRKDTIEIVDTSNPGIPIFHIPINIYRAPVIMVHGFMGDPSDFEAMKDTLITTGNYPNNLILRTNYKPTNTCSFFTNRDVLPIAINQMFHSTWAHNYSTGKVDVVGYSMGGNLARKYIQSDSFQSKRDIHKLITINTPHSGSQLANLVVAPPSCSDAAISALGSYLYSIKYHISHQCSIIGGGAIKDLKVNSTAMDTLNNINLNNGIVPSHSIVTEGSFLISKESWPESILLAAKKCYTTFTMNSFVDYLFYGDSNDLVVSNSSQIGGLPSLDVTHYYNQAHINSPSNQQVINQVENLLNISSDNSSFFAQSGYSPVDLSMSSHFRLVEPDSSYYKIIPGSMKITSPSAGLSFNPGDVTPIKFTTSNGINRTLMEAFTENGDYNYIDTALSSGTLRYIIPDNAFGKIGIILLGYDTTSGTFIDWDTISMNVNITAGLDSITYYPDTNYIQISEIMPLSVNGYFDNGYYYDISNAKGLKYEVIDTTIAENVETNLVKGKRVGRTLVSVMYLGKRQYIPIVVTNGDTSIHFPTGIESPTLPFNNNGLGKFNPLLIFPNPSSGVFTFQCKTKIGESIQIQVYNQFGQRIFMQNEKSINETFTKKIILTSAIPGIYYLRVITQSHIYSASIVLIR